MAPSEIAPGVPGVLVETAERLLHSRAASGQGLMPTDLATLDAVAADAGPVTTEVRQFIAALAGATDVRRVAQAVFAPVTPAATPAAPARAISRSDVGESVQVTAPGVPPGIYTAVYTEGGNVGILVPRSPVWTALEGHDVVAGDRRYVLHNRRNGPAPRIDAFERRSLPADAVELSGKRVGDTITLEGQDYRLATLGANGAEIEARRPTALAAVAAQSPPENPAQILRQDGVHEFDMLPAENGGGPTFLASVAVPASAIRPVVTGPPPTRQAFDAWLRAPEPSAMVTGFGRSPIDALVRGATIRDDQGRIWTVQSLDAAHQTLQVCCGGTPPESKTVAVRPIGLEAWVHFPAQDGDVEGFGTQPLAGLRPGGELLSADGARWRIQQVQSPEGVPQQLVVRGGTPPADRTVRVRPAEDLFPVRPGDYDPATGLVTLRRPEFAAVPIHREVRLPGFPWLPTQALSDGATIHDSHKRAWVVERVVGDQVTLRRPGGARSQVLTMRHRPDQARADYLPGPLDPRRLSPGSVVRDKEGQTWHVFEVGRGAPPNVTLRRDEVATVTASRLMSNNPHGPPRYLEVLPDTRAEGGWLGYVTRFLSTATRTPLVGTGVLASETVSPAAPLPFPRSSATNGSPAVVVSAQRYTYTLPGGHQVNVDIPVAPITVPGRPGQPAVTISHEQMRTVAQEAIAAIPVFAVGSMDAIRFNPMTPADSATGADMEVNGRTVEIYPNSMVSTPDGSDEGRLYRMRQIFWHELGHAVAAERLGAVEGGGMWAQAMAADGRGNRPSDYGGTNNAEDLAETMRFYVATGGGEHSFFDTEADVIRDGASVRAQFAHRFAVLDHWFASAPTRPGPAP